MSDTELARIEKDVARRVGAAIRRGREERGWRQTDLAEAANMQQGTLSKWERGTLTPSIAELAWLEQCLDLKPGALFTAAELVPANMMTVNEIMHDPELDEHQREFVLSAYWAGILVTRSEREAEQDVGASRRRKHRGS